MTTRTLTRVGLASSSQGYSCGYEATRAALGGTDPQSISLALLFTSHPEPEQVLHGVHAVLDGVPLVGATSAGEYTHEGYVEQGAGVMLISSDTFRFYTLSQQRRWFGRGRLLSGLQGLSNEGLGSEYAHRALVLFPDDQSANLDAVLDRAITESAMMYDILGGPGPMLQDPPPRPPALFCNDRVYRTGLTGAEILSTRPFGLALTNGWQPISGPYRVTKTAERAIVTIDGRPTREIYEDFAEENGLSMDAIEQNLLHYPVGVCEGVGDCKVSVAMGFDRNGALLVGSPPRTNSLIHILGTRPDAMLAAATRALSQAMARIEGTQPGGLLFIDCMSTAMILADSYNQQQAAVRQQIGDDVPFLGFRSHGVLARLQGQTQGHYECSVAACALPA